MPSCTVRRQLLTDIEAYILSRWNRFDPQQKPRYHFLITDPIGTETIPSVTDYLPSLFPDDIQEATLSLRARDHEQQLSSLKVTFGVRGGSEISVELNGPNARELAKGIIDGVLGYVRPWQNYNGLLHPSFGAFLGLLIVVPLLAFAAALAWVTWFHSKNSKEVGPVVMFCAIGLFVVLGGVTSWLRPYTVFETRLNQRRAGLARMAGALLIGVVGSVVAALLLRPFFK